MVMLRVFLLLVLSVQVSLGCGDSGGTPDGAALAADALPDTPDLTPDGAPDGAPDVAPDAPSDAPDSADTSVTSDTSTGPAYVAFVDALVAIDGTPVFLYGADLHYFRVRDPGYDPGFTEERWIGTLNLMRAAGMNLVSTYAPWDYHQLGPDSWDFTGARDLSKFLDLACARGFHVILKPGPLITGEWPKGFWQLRRGARLVEDGAPRIARIESRWHAVQLLTERRRNPDPAELPRPDLPGFRA